MKIKLPRLIVVKKLGKIFSPCWFSNENNSMYGNNSSNNSKRVHPPVPGFPCKRKEEQHQQQPVPQHQQASGKNPNTPKKPRLVFTDLQRRTLQAIFKETKRPSKEMQITISQQLGLELSTVGNFFMNARRRSQDKWQDEDNKSRSKYESTNSSSSSSTTSSTTAVTNNNHHHHHNSHHHTLIGGGLANHHPSSNHHLLSSPLLVSSNPSVVTSA